MRSPSYLRSRLAARLRTSFRRLASGCDEGIAGVSAVEFAIIAPVFVVAIICTIDIGAGFYRKMQVQSAAQVGAQYAALHGFDATNIANAITSATAFSGIAASPSPAQFCGCASASGIGAVDCASKCPSGSSPGSYITASAQGTYTTILPYPLLSSSYTLNAQSTLRIQ
jgi:Flp pilus assembly protein TadG